MPGWYDEITWGIATSFVAFLLGLAWTRLTQLVVNHRARRFWRPLVSEDLSVVVGRFRLNDFEPSGVVGAGDNIALNELSTHLAKIGFKRFSVSYHDEHVGHGTRSAASLHGNLILLGGPDANSLTHEVLTRTALGIHFTEVSPARLEALRSDRARVELPLVDGVERSRFGRRRLPSWRVPIIVDVQSQQVHGPEVGPLGLRTDCGVMIRCPNPFNPRREVIIFCGSYGYGTWAAV